MLLSLFKVSGGLWLKRTSLWRARPPVGNAKSSERGFPVVRDIYNLKLLAIEVVCQLALDTVSERPKDSPLFSQLVEQIQEEIDHLNQCRIFLSQRDALETSPPYVQPYSRVMRSCASRRHRTLPLAVAVLFCIAVEKSAMEQIAKASVSDWRIADLLKSWARMKKTITS